jgi:16S rRNA (adenine1518-N6/adenine1519-N6)-dimethyltransferase
MNPREMLEAFGINPKKSLGQNFMHDPNTIEKIAVTAEIMPDDTVVEVGPGTGELTERLAQSARHVMAIEVDERLQPLLEERFAHHKNVYFIFNDVLKINVAQLVGAKDYLLVANVPYYITTAILEHVLSSSHRPKRIVITMQYEVAQRICATPGDMSLLAVSVQYYGKPQIVSKLNPAVFWPRPGVDSAVLRVDCYDKPIVDAPSDELFFRVVKAGFSQKRKQLRNSISGGLQVKNSDAGEYLEAAGIDSTRRAETLTLEEWARLAHVIAEVQGLSR